MSDAAGRFKTPVEQAETEQKPIITADEQLAASDIECIDATL
ncbi:MAG: hypothetical protein ABFR53_12280 [Actinomycetota bacterium]